MTAPSLAPLYESFFGLKHAPFSIAPDPRYLYMSERHREALAHLLYGLGSGGGFVLLTGAIGAGKTTVCRAFLEQVPAECDMGYVFNPKLTVPELLRTVCDEFHVVVPAGVTSVKPYVDALNTFLLANHGAGRHSVLIIDEAQNLSVDVLEQLRLLTNLETPERKLLQIILIGQPELREMLRRPRLEQLAQRVIARYHLEALSEADTLHYIAHRLAVAGLAGPLPFDAAALAAVHRASRGVPRRINLLCDRALLGAYAGGLRSIDAAIVERAAREVFDNTPAARVPAAPRSRTDSLLFVGLGLLTGGAIATTALSLWYAPMRDAKPGSGQPATAAAVAASAAATAASAASGVPVARALSASSPVLRGADDAPAGPTAVAPAALWAGAVRSPDQAWAALANLWGVQPAPGEDCSAARRLTAGLGCWRTDGASLALVRQFDRPVLLMVDGDDQQPAHVLLVGLGSQSARLRIPGAEATVPLSELAARWRGGLGMVFKVPAGYDGSIDADGSAGLSSWLADQLSLVEPTSAASASGRSLRERVSAFQLAQGLRPDGRAGPATLMQLNRARRVDEPRLLALP